MKLRALIFTGVLLVGCSEKHAVDTGVLQRDFPAVTVSNIVVAVASNEYPKAMVALQKLSRQPQLTPVQQKAIRDTMLQVQEKMTEAALKAKSGAH